MYEYVVLSCGKDILLVFLDLTCLLSCEGYEKCGGVVERTLRKSCKEVKSVKRLGTRIFGPLEWGSGTRATRRILN